MASAFGHAFAAVTLGSAFGRRLRTGKFWILGMFAAILPDADVITFAFGIPYESIWGHRGISHSAVAALAIGMGFAFIFYRKSPLKERVFLVLYFFLCAFSHGLLDMLTDGGMGVAMFAPFENNRHFFSFRPIRVSPIGVESFFSAWGRRVILSEAVWIGLPGVIFIGLSILGKRRFRNR